VSYGRDKSEVSHMSSNESNNSFFYERDGDKDFSWLLMHTSWEDSSHCRMRRELGLLSTRFCT
jgi:hypothetical protein